MEIAPLMVTSLKAQSNGISDSRRGNDVIEEILPRLSGLPRIHGEVEFAEGAVLKTPHFVEQGWFFGHGKKIRRKEYVDEKTVNLRINYPSGRELERSYQDLAIIEENSGLRFTDWRLTCFLNSSRFHGPWSLRIEKVGPGRYGQENKAVVLLEVPPLDAMQRQQLAELSDRLYLPAEETRGKWVLRTPLSSFGSYDAEPPIIGVERTWPAAFGEYVIQEFFDNVVRAAEEFGVPLDTDFGGERKLSYRVRLIDGKVTRTWKNQTHHFPRLEIGIKKYHPLNEQYSFHYDLCYSSDESYQKLFDRYH